MTETISNGFVAECYWSGARPDDLRSLDERVRACVNEVERTGESVRYLGSMLIVEDEVVLCLFEGSQGGVGRVAERAAIPFERILRSTRVSGPEEGRTTSTPQRREGRLT
jgi:hypothetical protein